MSKYIDEAHLLAEIDRRILQEQGFEDGEAEYGYKCALKDIKRFITSLQQEQPEVDLEAEIEKAGKDVLRQAHYRNKIFDIPQTMFDDVQLMDIFKSGVYKGYELGRRCAL